MTTSEHNGLVTVRSRLSHGETVAALTADIQKRGATIFATIDHAKAAVDIGMTLRPTTVIVFGNAKAGTPLMQQQQTVGIDLPLKLLVWEAAQGATQVTYNDPSWIASRHGIAGSPVLGAMTTMLEAITASVR
jgi:uncharacterized protein (DUF302 family)